MASALGLKKFNGTECRKVYEELITQIFKQGWWDWVTSKISSCKYSDKALRENLDRFFSPEVDEVSSTPAKASTPS